MSGTSEDLEISLSVCLSVSTSLAFGLAVCEKGRGGGSPADWSWLRADLPQHRSLEKGFHGIMERGTTPGHSPGALHPCQ